jgi:predicted phage terminase large subunit-like protein
VINTTEFKKRFEELTAWICNNVQAFADESPEARRARVERSAVDKIYFSETYFPHYCDDDFAPMHKEMFSLADTLNEPVVIAGFRESGKSTIISLIDVLHKILFKQRYFVLIISANEDNATEYTMNIQAELDFNKRLQSDFGELHGSRWMLNDMITNSGQRILAVGLKMPVKGKRTRQRRPDHIIFEDIEDVNLPSSPRVIKQRLKWLVRSVLKSVNSKKWSAMFLGNYYSKRTIIHKLLSDKEYSYWKRKVYSATYVGKDGKLHSNWPARHPLVKLFKQQEEDPATYRVEMGQKPDDEDAYFNDNWIQYYQEDELPASMPVVTYVDPSALKGEEHCFKAIITLAVDAKNMDYYVLNAWIKKTSKWHMVRSHFDISKKFHSSVDGIESNGFQSTLKEDYEIEEKTRGATLNMKLINNTQNKEVRIGTLSSVVERGKLKFMRNHSDQNELITQLLDFPDGDLDGPDALAGAKALADRFILKITRKVKAGVVEA